MSFETFAIVALSALLAAGAAATFATLRRGRSLAAEAQRQLDDGHFQQALEAAETEPGADRDVRLTAAVAAKHLLDLPRARRLLEALLAREPADGEAWLELGLVAAYQGRLEEAARAFERAAATRSDLLESLTLHRAWLAGLAGDASAATRLFSEIEVPLETKLRQDLGEGDPSFAEWFLHAGLLWRGAGDTARSDWALAAARRAAPESRLIADRSDRRD
jgi:tetratricopeptide (TPR) repeat protein